MDPLLIGLRAISLASWLSAWWAEVIDREVMSNPTPSLVARKNRACGFEKSLEEAFRPSPMFMGLTLLKARYTFNAYIRALNGCPAIESPRWTLFQFFRSSALPGHPRLEANRVRLPFHCPSGLY